MDYEYAVLLEWTRCHYGGERAWFRCPVIGCGRRVAILYGGAIFARALAAERSAPVSRHEFTGCREERFRIGARVYRPRKNCFGIRARLHSSRGTIFDCTPRGSPHSKKQTLLRSDGQ
jgi:hypothetical protein